MRFIAADPFELNKNAAANLLVNSGGSELKLQYSQMRKILVLLLFFEKTVKPLIYAKDERRRTFIEGVNPILYKGTVLAQ